MYPPPTPSLLLPELKALLRRWTPPTLPSAHTPTPSEIGRWEVREGGVLLLIPPLYNPIRPPSDQCPYAFICAPSSNRSTSEMPPLAWRCPFMVVLITPLITRSTMNILFLLHTNPPPPCLCHSSLLLTFTSFPLLLLSHISASTLFRRRLRPLSFSSVLIIPYLCRHFCHYPPVSFLQSLSHHFPSPLRSSSEFLSRGPLYHSALIILRCLLWSNFLAQSCSNLRTMLCYYLSMLLFLLHSAPIRSTCSTPLRVIIHHFSLLRFNWICSFPSALSTLLYPLHNLSDLISLIWNACLDRLSLDQLAQLCSIFCSSGPSNLS